MAFKKDTNKKKKRIVAVKQCMFCKEKNENEIDYKNIALLGKYVNQKARITSRRINGNCAKHQRRVSYAIRRARVMALLPYVGR